LPSFPGPEAGARDIAQNACTIYKVVIFYKGTLI